MERRDWLKRILAWGAATGAGFLIAFKEGEAIDSAPLDGTPYDEWVISLPDGVTFRHCSTMKALFGIDASDGNNTAYLHTSEKVRLVIRDGLLRFERAEKG